MRLRSHPWVLALGGFSLVYAALLPLSNLVVGLHDPGWSAELLWVLGALALGLVLGSLLLGGLLRFGLRGDSPERRRERAHLLIVVAGLGLLVLAGAVALDRALLRGLPRGAWLERFDDYGWRSQRGNVERRTRMLGDLTTRVLPGRSLGDVSRLLGADDGWGRPALPGRSSLVYVVGHGFIDPVILEIEFDAAGRYVKHVVRET